MASKDMMDDEVKEVETAEESKKQQKPKKEKKKKAPKEKGGKGGLITFIFVALVIGGLIGLIFTNAWGLREKYLRTYLEKIPFVNRILPEAPEQPMDEFSELNRSQLVDMIKILETQIQTLDNDKVDLNKKIDELNAEMLILQGIAAQQEQFKAEKEDFDRLVALNDPTAYSKYYGEIYPENAEELYKEAVVTIQNDKDLQNYVETFEAMKKDSAAGIMGEMLKTDMDLVVMILQNISSEKRAEILGAMTPKDASNVSKRMAPQ